MLQRLAPALSALLLLGMACQPAAPAPGATQPAAPATAPSPAVSPAPLPSAVAAASPVASMRTQIPTADPAAHVFLWGEFEAGDRDLRLAREAGFTWVKQRFEWRNIERDGKGKFEWNEPDRIMQMTEQQGLKMIARVDNQPKWANTRVTYPASAPPENLQDWTDYLTALATRYKGRIAAYEIWNEPNLAREWGGQKPDPAAYTRLLTASYRAIKAADPRALVVSAGLSPTTTSNNDAMPDMAFYRAMYQAGARGSFDLLGAHAAGFKADPCADPAQVAQSAELTNGDQSPVEARRVYAFRHVEDIRQLMVEQGDGDKQIGIVESGWTTDRRPGSEYAWFGVTPEQQAQNLVGAFQCARQRWAPWAAFLTIIYIGSPQWTPQQEQYWWSITNPDGSPRPAYNALKAFLNP